METLSFNKNESKYASLIAFLMGISYFLIYVNIPIYFVTNIAAVLISYLYLIRYKSIVPVILLIISTRSINGFVISNNVTAFGIFSIITCHLPVLLYILINLRRPSSDKYHNFRCSIIYFGFVLFNLLLNISHAIPLISKQILPLAWFVIVVLFTNTENFRNIHLPLIKALRIIFIFNLIVFFLPDYASKTMELMSSGNVFGTNVEDLLLSYKNVVRNQGLVFDSRIWGLVVCMFFILNLRYKEKVQFKDIVISSFTIFTTIARGSILVFLALFVLYLYRNHKKIVYPIFIIIMILSFINTGTFFIKHRNSAFAEIISTLDLSNDDNVFSQRGELRLYAVSRFIESPIWGIGLGEITVPSNNTHVNIDIYTSTNVVTDAYIFSLAAELGIIGLILFLISFIEISRFTNKDKYSLILLIMLIVQMTGTDLPNMYMFYFLLLISLQIPQTAYIKRNTFRFNSV